MTSAIEFIDEPDTIRNEAIDNGMLITNDQTTEKLHELLDERGVKYEAYRDIKNRCITKWRTCHGAFVFFAVEKEGKLFVETTSDTEHSAVCTPEQAVSATLGGDSSADDALAILDEIRDADRISYDDYSRLFDAIAVLDDGKLTAEQVRKAVNSHGNIMDNRLYENWQAVADELNATLGSETYELQYVESGAIYVVWRYTCCGYEHAESLSEKAIPQNFCPNCGGRMKVVK